MAIFDKFFIRSTNRFQDLTGQSFHYCKRNINVKKSMKTVFALQPKLTHHHYATAKSFSNTLEDLFQRSIESVKVWPCSKSTIQFF